MLGLSFKEEGKTIRFDTTINKSWVVKTSVSCCLVLLKEILLLIMLLIMGSNPTTVTKVIVKWCYYCQYNGCDRILFQGRGRRKIGFRHYFNVSYTYRFACHLKIDLLGICYSSQGNNQEWEKGNRNGDHFLLYN